VAGYYLAGNVEGACDRVVKEAQICWRRVSTIQEDEVIDDITVIIAFLSP